MFDAQSERGERERQSANGKTEAQQAKSEQRHYEPKTLNVFHNERMYGERNGEKAAYIDNKRDQGVETTKRELKSSIFTRVAYM